MMAWLRRLHAWVGLGLCLLLGAIAFSGASLVFKPEIRRLVSAEARGPVPALTPQALAVVMREAEGRFGAGKLGSVIFASPEAVLHEATLRDGSGAAFDGQGRMVEAWRENGRVYDVLFDLHHRLFSGETGTTVTGCAGVLALAMLVSGLVLWWPSRRSFRALPFPHGPGRNGWLAAHRDLAVMAAPMIAISLTTGSLQALQDFSRPLLHAPAPKAPKAKTTGPVDWDGALSAAQQRFPGAVLRIAVEPRKKGPVTIRLRQPGEWHINGRTIVYLEPASAEIIGVYDDAAQNPGARLFNSLWPIHAAKVGGLPWKLLIFLGGVSLGLLSLYGGEAYRRRLMGERR